MDYIQPLLLILGGILAISGLIVAKKPDAQKLIDKLMPYQAFIGVGLLAWGIYNLLRSFSLIRHGFGIVPIWTLIILAAILSSIALGFMFGMPQIAKWIPGEGAAEQKGLELSKKLAPYQTIIGIVGLVSGLALLLMIWGILKPM